MNEKELYYYKIGEPVLVKWKEEWEEGEIINVYSDHDGVINVQLRNGENIWFDEARHKEYMKTIISEIPKANNLCDLKEGHLEELEDYIEQLVTLKSYVNGFIAQHNLDENEVYEKIENDYEEAMSRQNG